MASLEVEGLPSVPKPSSRYHETTPVQRENRTVWKGLMSIYVRCMYISRVVY